MWKQKLTTEQKTQIKRSGKSSEELAKKYNVTLTYINVLRRQAVRELTIPYDDDYIPDEKFNL